MPFKLSHEEWEGQMLVKIQQVRSIECLGKNEEKGLVGIQSVYWGGAEFSESISTYRSTYYGPRNELLESLAPCQYKIYSLREAFEVPMTYTTDTLS